MNLIFGFAQLFLYHPLFLLLLYTYLVIFIPLKSAINITNILPTLLKSIRIK
uniref:Uncharacterized protein n=1 Tax=Anthoceros agrestis TaxID=41834 RepID=A0A6M8AZV7_9EMBR|nr:hypothetical protein [Anthoceros agrestis]QKD76501.1 hypothetical protein [Anthoceros agrestis]